MSSHHHTCLSDSTSLTSLFSSRPQDNSLFAALHLFFSFALLLPLVLLSGERTVAAVVALFLRRRKEVLLGARRNLNSDGHGSGSGLSALTSNSIADTVVDIVRVTVRSISSPTVAGYVFLAPAAALPYICMGIVEALRNLRSSDFDNGAPGASSTTDYSLTAGAVLGAVAG